MNFTYPYFPAWAKKSSYSPLANRWLNCLKTAVSYGNLSKPSPALPAVVAHIVKVPGVNVKIPRIRPPVTPCPMPGQQKWLGAMLCTDFGAFSNKKYSGINS